jgi:hypothetical protein
VLVEPFRATKLVERDYMDVAARGPTNSCSLKVHVLNLFAFLPRVFPLPVGEPRFFLVPVVFMRLSPCSIVPPFADTEFTVTTGDNGDNGDNGARGGTCIPPGGGQLSPLSPLSPAIERDKGLSYIFFILLSPHPL